jgi:XFP C-terminal domain
MSMSPLPGHANGSRDIFRKGAECLGKLGLTLPRGRCRRRSSLGTLAAYTKQAMRDRLIEHKRYITRYGDDMPEVKQWRWLEAGG